MSIGLFVDGGYSRHSCKGVDVDALARYVEGVLHDKVAQAVYFDGEPKFEHAATRRFLAALQWPRSQGGPGFKVKLYPVEAHPVVYPGGGQVVSPEGKPLMSYKQVGVDIGLALAMLRGRDEFKWDKVALMAGDGDFAETLAELRGSGVQLCVLCGGKTLSKHLLSLDPQLIDVLAEPASLYLKLRCSTMRHSLTRS